MIYYLICEVEYEKNKSKFVDRNAWVISIYTSPIDIMLNDRRSIRNLEDRYYGKSYKSKRKITIRKVVSKKPLSRRSTQAL